MSALSTREDVQQERLSPEDGCDGMPRAELKGLNGLLKKLTG